MKYIPLHKSFQTARKSKIIYYTKDAESTIVYMEDDNFLTNKI